MNVPCSTSIYQSSFVRLSFCFHPHCYPVQTALKIQQVTLSTQMLEAKMKQNGISPVLEESGNVCIGTLLRSGECL